jgi:hypothetical protein
MFFACPVGLSVIYELLLLLLLLPLCNIHLFELDFIDKQMDILVQNLDI